MSYNRLIPYETKGGNEYVVRLQVCDSEQGLPIVDVTLTRLNKVAQNGIQDLCGIAQIVKTYIEMNDVILYYYCAFENTITQRDEKVAPQEYRKRLFDMLYARISDASFYKKDVIIVDPRDNTKHYISLISKIEHQAIVDNLSEKELTSFEDK